MNDEIKEILDRLDYNEWEVDLYKVPITWCELYDIRDYITNLQQKNNNLTEDFKRHIDRINELTERNDNLQQELEEEKRIEEADLHKIQSLEEENERLKETNVYCNRTDCVGRIKDSRKYDSVYQEKEDYKSRCEKAIEFIKKVACYENYGFCNDIGGDSVDNLLNILQNGSENK